MTMTATTNKIPDGGWGWVVVLAAAVISAIADGATFSFGLLFIEFLKEFELSKASTSWIGSLFLAVPLLTGTIMSTLVDRYGCRLMTIVGGLISTVGFVLSAFVRDIRVMYLTFGVMTGLGLGLCYVTLVVSVAFWFEKKRMLAVSLGSCGTGIGTFVYAPLTQFLIGEYGWRGTTIFLAGGFLNICVCGALMRDPDWIVEQNEREDDKKRLLCDNGGEFVVQGVGGGKGEVGRCHSMVHLPTFMKPSVKVPIEVLQQLSSTEHDYSASPDNRQSLLSCRSISASKPLDCVIEEKVAATPVTVSMAIKKQEKTFPRVESFPWLRNHRGYLRNMRFRRGSSVHRGAFLNIHRYKPKASSCPDIYRNSMISLPKEAAEKWYYEIVQLLKSMADFSFLKELHFLLFFLSTILLFMWVVVPYFYLAEHLISNGYSETDTSLVLSTIGVANTIGIIVLGWAGDQPWLNVTKTYAISLILCGITVVGMIIFTQSVIMEFTCAALFGLFFASNLSFTPGILVEIVPFERFTMAYGLILMSQGIGHLIGPPLGGLLNDLTANWEQAFWQAGLWIVLSGILVGLVPFVENRRIVGKGPVAKVLASEKGGII